MTRSRSIVPTFVSLAILAAILLTTCGCRSFRGFVMDANNRNMSGKLAPGVSGESWWLPEDVSSPPDASGTWTVVAFFKPG